MSVADSSRAEQGLKTRLTDKQVEEARRIFDLFDKDHDGQISQSEFALAIKEVKFTDVPAERIMKETDIDRSNGVSFAEFVDALSYKTNALGDSTLNFNRLVRFVALYHVPRNKTGELDYLSQYKFWPPPIVMIIFTIVEVAVFIHYSSKDCNNNPSLECPLSFSTEAAFRPGCREEVWRFFTYIFVHAGMMHIMFNMLIQILVGVPLEMVHGPLRVLGVYCMGALATSLASSVFDPRSNLVGASGAVYALIGAHVADVVVNWEDMPFRYIRAGVLILLIGLDFSISIYNRYFNSTTSSVSYVGHFSGFVMGCTLGTAILKNLHETGPERILKIIGITIACIGVVFAIFWNIFYDYNTSTCPNVG